MSFDKLNMNMNKPVFNVSEINNYIKMLIDHDMLLYQVWVKGEISNFKFHSSGHIYMTLKDESSAIRAVMFRNANIHLKFKPENGMKVIARGRVTVYERDGQYQLYVDEMQPDGIGSLYIAFEQLKAKLQKEGLFDETRKKPLPRFPKRIGVVTSPTGAAIRDILHVLGRRYACAEVLIFPVLVQGLQASSQIVEGIQYFNKEDNVDVIITGRGGGSIEELWAFNEEIVARAVAQSKIPVISAVGHETDFTIVDFVSDLRAPTPSAAAEMAVPSRYELQDRINNLQARLYFAVNTGIENRRVKVENITWSAAFRNPLDKIYESRLVLDELNKRMEKGIAYQIRKNKESLGFLCGKLDALSPLSVLARGYGIAKKNDGTIIKSVDEVSKEERIDVQLSDGNLYCTVSDKVRSER